MNEEAIYSTDQYEKYIWLTTDIRRVKLNCIGWCTPTIWEAKEDIDSKLTWML